MNPISSNINRSHDPLRLKVIGTIDSYGLLDNAKSVLLGLSGGIDSTVLFDVLISLRERYDFTLYAVHINHMIRGDESDRDENFVRSLCEQNGIRLFVKRIDVPQIGKETGKSLELAARDARYEAFDEIMESNGIDVVATAHNADDNAETMIYNIVRGTFLSGLSGIPYKRGRIIRPLRDVTRTEINAYAERFSLAHVEDSTNANADCTRNILRLNVIPILKTLNPSLTEMINEESKAFASVNEFMNHYAEKMSGDISSQPEGAILSYISYIYPKGVDRETAFKIVKAIKSHEKCRFVLSHGDVMIVENGNAEMEEEKNKNIFLPIEYKELKYGKNILENGICVYRGNKNFNEINNFTTIVSLNSAIIDKKVFLRSRAEGDTIRINGMTKSIKKVFIDKKIPKEVRIAVPVVCMDSKVIACPYIGVDDSVKVKEPNGERITFCFPFRIIN